MHSFRILSFPIPSVTHQTGGLSINCIYVLSVYPILTFDIPPTCIICGIVYGVNQFVYVHSFLSKIYIAQHQYIPADLKLNILPYHLVCSASHVELNFYNYLWLILYLLTFNFKIIQIHFFFRRIYILAFLLKYINNFE